MWRARYRDPAGKRACRHFARRVDAQRWLDEVTTSIITGAYVDPDAGKIDCADWWSAWSERQTWTSSTRATAELSAKSVTFGHVPLRMLRRAHVEEWIKAMTLPSAFPGVGGIDDPHTLQLRPYGTRGRGEGPNDCREPRQRRDTAEAAPTSHRHDHPDARSAQRGSSTPPLTSSARTSTSAPSLDYGSARLPRSGPGTSTPRLTF